MLAVLAVILAAAGAATIKFGLPWWKSKPPPASGGELQVRVLDVGQGDSILIVSPEHKVVLVDAGDATKSKNVLEALKRNGVEKIDYFIATHAHPDHIGAAADVIKNIGIGTILDSGYAPEGLETKQQSNKNANDKSGKGKGAQTKNAPKTVAGKQSAGKTLELPTVKAYREMREAAEAQNVKIETAAPGSHYDLGGGARLTVLAPTQPFFTKDQMTAGGNDLNANSIMLRLDYGDFSMLLAGDAEAQTEHRLLTQGGEFEAKILKVAHHGSKYATTQEFLDRVRPEVAIISDGEYNRYGHPSQAVLDRLKTATAKVYRTDLQGEITITTKGKEGYQIKTEKEFKGDVYMGREAQKDDSSRSGFVAYGDFGPPPRPPKDKPAQK